MGLDPSHVEKLVDGGSESAGFSPQQFASMLADLYKKMETPFKIIVGYLQVLSDTYLTPI